jgi:hypothetical protein
MASHSAFKACEIQADGIGMAITLVK